MTGGSGESWLSGGSHNDNRLTTGRRGWSLSEIHIGYGGFITPRCGWNNEEGKIPLHYQRPAAPKAFSSADRRSSELAALDPTDGAPETETEAALARCAT